MERILQSLEKYNEGALLDSESGEISFYSKTERPDLASRKSNGIFSHLDNQLISFYRIDDKLVLRTETKTIEFQDQDELLIELMDDRQNRFKILRGKEILLSYTYRRPNIKPPISVSKIVNPTIEEEDFDICLFAYNVLRNKERAQRIFKG